MNESRRANHSLNDRASRSCLHVEFLTCPTAPTDEGVNGTFIFLTVPVVVEQKSTLCSLPEGTSCPKAGIIDIPILLVNEYISTRAL